MDVNTELHTPVSNVSDSDAAAKTTPQPPSEGTEPGVAAPGTDIENVEGYALSAPASSAAEAELEGIDDLPDIAWASFGEPSPDARSIIGSDDRVQITDTASYPWRVHASLLITAADGSRWIGTAWFLGPHTLGTAGHVVFIKNSGVAGRDGWVRSIQVIPGRNGSQQPFGSVLSSNLRSVTGWTVNGDQNFDYGAIILPSDLGSRTGWLGFAAFDDATIRASVANISGYPGDKPAGTQWYHGSRVTAVNAQKVFYETDTVGGQSGSAVYRLANGARSAFAIHCYGGATSNSGTRINSQVFNNLLAWKA